MQFDGTVLEQVLAGQREEVGVYDCDSFLRGLVQPWQALDMARGGRYVGIGNRRRIRVIRPLDGATAKLGDASRFVRRVPVTRFDLDTGIRQRNGLTYWEHKPLMGRVR